MKWDLNGHVRHPLCEIKDFRMARVPIRIVTCSSNGTFECDKLNNTWSKWNFYIFYTAKKLWNYLHHYVGEKDFFAGVNVRIQFNTFRIIALKISAYFQLHFAFRRRYKASLLCFSTIKITVRSLAAIKTLKRVLLCLYVRFSLTNYDFIFSAHTNIRSVVICFKSLKVYVFVLFC